MPGIMDEWQLEREQMRQLSRRHAVLHHNKWSSSYIPAYAVPGLKQGERMDRSKMTKMQAKLMHAVADLGEREASGLEQAHGWRLTAERSQQRARLEKKGFRFARVGRRMYFVYGEGQPYQPCPDEPRLGAPIGGWNEHTDWTPDRNLPAGNSQAWFEAEPKPRKQKPNGSARGSDDDVGGWQPGRSLAPRRPKGYVSSRDLESAILRDMKRGTRHALFPPPLIPPFELTKCLLRISRLALATRARWQHVYRRA